MALFHHPIVLVHPEIDASTCGDFAISVATLKRLINQFIETGALIVPAHFSSPHVGRLAMQDGKG